VERVHVLFVDCDDEAAIDALEHFERAASMIVNSGRGRHSYWSIFPPVSPDEAERANRRLAHALGADMRATDAARNLRPPRTFNFKSGEPAPVTLERLDDVHWTAYAQGSASPSSRRRRAKPDAPLEPPRRR
jgi:RepB DNA-primase from phage plasmid